MRTSGSPFSVNTPWPDTKTVLLIDDNQTKTSIINPILYQSMGSDNQISLTLGNGLQDFSFSGSFRSCQESEFQSLKRLCKLSALLGFLPRAACAGCHRRAKILLLPHIPLETDTHVVVGLHVGQNFCKLFESQGEDFLFNSRTLFPGTNQTTLLFPDLSDCN